MSYDFDIKTVKAGLEEIQYWWAAGVAVCGIALTILLKIKKARDWIFAKAKAIYSKWPYQIIRRLEEEIKRLKGERLTDDEVLILQSLWAFGVVFTITQDRVMEIVGCKSQEASYLIHRLEDLQMVYYDNRADGYKLSPTGQKYIMDHNHKISKDEFVRLMQEKGRLAA